jgi:hypothetical protein
MPTITGTAGNDQLNGGATDDILIGLAGSDMLNGGPGGDAADYQDAPAAIDVNLLTGVAQDGYGSTDSLNSIEQVGGSAFNDKITGDGGNNYGRRARRRRPDQRRRRRRPAAGRQRG